MLRITAEKAKYCDGLTRRSFVQAGMLGVGGLGLADLSRLQAANAIRPDRKETSVILFW